MKKIIITIVIITVIASAFIAGRAAGIRHAIEDSQIWTVDRYDPDDPEESSWNGYDQKIFIDLDGETYAHGMIQG